MPKDYIFPKRAKVGDLEVAEGGISKREYFAGLAMQNLQNVLWRKSGHVLFETMKELLDERSAPRVIARLAIEQADILIEELGRDPTV